MRVKLYCFFLLIVQIIVLSSCHNKRETYCIGVSQNSSDAWSRQLNHEMRREAWINKDVQLNIRIANDDNNLQIHQIDSLVREGIDLLVVSSNESEALNSIINKVMKQGIPVILTDRRMAVKSNYTAYIGADNRSIGRDIGLYVAKELKGKGTLLELTGNLDGTVASERHKGMNDALSKMPDIHTLAMVEVGWEGPRIYQQMDSIFKRGIIPDIIIAPNDRTGVRIHEIISHLGHRNIRIVGVDGLSGPNGGLDNVEQGKLKASFLYPTGGDKVIQTALRILRHEPYDRNTQLRSAIIDESTMRAFSMQRDLMQERDQRINLLGTLVDKSLSRNTMQDMLLFACMVIIVLIGVVMGMGIRSYNNTIKRNEKLNRQKIKLEQQHDEMVKMAKELEESTQSKLTFFSEVSHDLRTPLTLILAPTEQLLQQSAQFTPEQRNLLQMVRSNADILLHLVQQVLDFRKFEVGQLRLNLLRIRIDKELVQWCKPFEVVARKRMIRLNVSCQPIDNDNLYEADVDMRKVESVVYNLLTNAFKYTPEGGKVNVKCRIDTSLQNERETCFVIEVEDTGKGIESDKLPHIFERYYQTDINHDGSGIGLATVKAFVELHGGTIKAESTTGVGSRFIVSIPMHQSADASKLTTEGIEAKETKQPIENSEAHTSFVANGIDDKKMDFAKISTNDNEVLATESDAKPIVLVVDDNADIRAYIHQLLQDEYTVEEASNGQEGLDKARQLMPDIVVCDVMMPVMDGLACCKHLKEEWQTSHIPVVLLTACTLDEQRAVGYHCGADSYINKPFTPDMLRIRLRNILDNRRRMKAYFSEKGITDANEISAPDKNFAERFKAIVEANIASPNLSVEDVALQLGMGRTQLYRKLKSLTGLSPIEVVRTIRLKKAAELLARTDKSVSEVAYEVGFSSVSYLSKCFKDYFGVNPKDYK